MSSEGAAKHLERLHGIHTAWRGHVVPLAAPPGSRYPYVYPRDLAAIARAFDHIGATGTASTRMLEGAAAFLVATQGLDGSWGQRYDLEAREQSKPVRERDRAAARGVSCCPLSCGRPQPPAPVLKLLCCKTGP